jgi:hypothetical protein
MATDLTAPSSFLEAWQAFLDVARESAIEVIGPDDVLAYLRRFPDTIAVTANLVSEARRQFGDVAELLLQLYRDPEYPDEYLRIDVRLPRYGADTLDRLDAVSAGCEQLLLKASGRVLVTTDFRAALPQLI